MNAHKRLLAAALVAQVVVAYCTWRAQVAFRLHWYEVLDGKPLPPITDLSLFSLRWIAFVFFVGLIASSKSSLTWTAYILLLEIVLLGILLLGVGYPIFSITYRFQ